eukprot:gene5253-3764_t
MNEGEEERYLVINPFLLRTLPDTVYNLVQNSFPGVFDNPPARHLNNAPASFLLHPYYPLQFEINITISPAWLTQVNRVVPRSPHCFPDNLGIQAVLTNGMQRTSLMSNNNPPNPNFHGAHPHPMTTRDYTSDEVRGESGMLPALKGSNYRLKPTFVPMRSRFRPSTNTTSNLNPGPVEPRSARMVSRTSKDIGSLSDHTAFNNKMSKLDLGIGQTPTQPVPTGSSAVNLIGSYQAIPTPTDGKCPPLVSSTTQREGLSSKGSSKPTSAGTAKSFSQTDLVSATMSHNGLSNVNTSNLTPYEEEEIKAYLPNVFYAGVECKRKILGGKGHPNNDGYDDENGHYRVAVGDHIAYRYEVLKELGRGTFGVVVKALDHKKRINVAVKIIKGKPSYTKQAKEEVKILELLGRDDPKDEAHVVRLLDTCFFRNHYILVFELLGMDLYSLCQLQQFKPLPLNFIYEFSCQILVALEYSRAHRIIHCDVKPENIVVSTTADTGKISSSNPLALNNLKLIDFGSACLQDRRLYSYIQSRYYRAPEIVLGIPYTHAIDMWSFGCVLCELANGYPIFPASSEGELLERIIEYLGPVPQEVLAKGKRVNKFYDEANELRPNLSKKGRPRKKPSSRSLQHFLKSAEDQSQDQSFFHLVSRCLEYNPSKRLTPREAMEHPWMKKMEALLAGRILLCAPLGTSIFTALPFIHCQRRPFPCKTHMPMLFLTLFFFFGFAGEDFLFSVTDSIATLTCCSMIPFI